MQNNCSDNKVVYAGFWVRLAAYLIDSVIVFAGLLIVRLVLSGMSMLLDGTWLGGNILFHYTLKDIVLYIAEVLYFILFTYFTGTTPGKKALNLSVVSAKEGEELTLLNVVYRETIGRFLAGIIAGIGYILIGIDKEKRGLHDILCDTRVVYVKKVKVYPVYQTPKVNYAPPVYRDPKPAEGAERQTGDFGQSTMEDSQPSYQDGQVNQYQYKYQPVPPVQEGSSAPVYKPQEEQ